MTFVCFIIIIVFQGYSLTTIHLYTLARLITPSHIMQAPNSRQGYAIASGHLRMALSA